MANRDQPRRDVSSTTVFSFSFFFVFAFVLLQPCDASPCPGQGTLTQAGLITDGLGADYSPNTVCTWTISPPATMQVLFKFNQIATAGQADAIELTEAGMPLGVYYGFPNSTADLISQSPGDSVILRFASDGQTQAAGFSISFSFVCPPGQGLMLTGGAGSTIRVCSPCNPGTFSTAKMDECVVCPSGMFSAETGKAKCDVCPDGLGISYGMDASDHNSSATCIYKRTYLGVASDVLWDGAQQACSSKSAELAVVSRADEQARLNAVRVQLYPNLASTVVWFGLKIAEDDTMRWVNDETMGPNPYTNFPPSESLGSGILRHGIVGADGLWHADASTTAQHAAMCMRIECSAINGQERYMDFSTGRPLCATATVCGPLEREMTPLTWNSDRACECDPAWTYNVGPGVHDCALLCGQPNQFVVRNATSQLPVKCRNLTECVLGQYEATAPTIFSDRSCLALSTCGMFDFDLIFELTFIFFFFLRVCCVLLVDGGYVAACILDILIYAQFTYSLLMTLFQDRINM